MTFRIVIAGIFAVTVLAAFPAVAQQVGTATAVNPASEGTPPGGATAPLTVGARVIHKERIHTSPSGGAQLLFLDKSSLSIAPNTDLVIDEFVYDPSTGQGHMLAKLTQGALRYVGGQLSHEGEASISTPNATIGIRGGSVTVIKGPTGTEVINHYGTLTIANGTGTITVTIPGYEVVIQGWNIPLGQPVKVTAAEIIHEIKLLTSKNGQNGGVGGFTGLQIASCGTANTASCPQPPWQSTDGGQDTANQIIIQATQTGTGQPPPPPPPHHYWSYGHSHP